VKSGFACEEDIKTIKCQISGRVQQLKRDREVRRLSTSSLMSVADCQQVIVTTAASSNPPASASKQCSEDKDGHVDGSFVLFII